jgi:hypothetical protein
LAHVDTIAEAVRPALAPVHQAAVVQVLLVAVAAAAAAVAVVLALPLALPLPLAKAPCLRVNFYQNKHV